MGRPSGSKNKRTGGGTAFIVPSLDGGTVSPPDYTEFGTGSADSDSGNSSADGTSAAGNTPSGEYDIYGNPDRGYGTKPDGSFRQRRANGTGTGSASSAQKRKIPLDLKGIEAMLLSIHGMGAMMLKIPELALTEQESAMMSAGIANVAKHYPETGMSEKTLAWVNLGVVMMGVYGTRAVAISNNRKRAKKAAQNNAASAPNVFTLQPGIEKG